MFHIGASDTGVEITETDNSEQLVKKIKDEKPEEDMSLRPQQDTEQINQQLEEEFEQSKQQSSEVAGEQNQTLYGTSSQLHINTSARDESLTVSQNIKNNDDNSSTIAHVSLDKPASKPNKHRVVSPTSIMSPPANHYYQHHSYPYVPPFFPHSPMRPPYYYPPSSHSPHPHHLHYPGYDSFYHQSEHMKWPYNVNTQKGKLSCFIYTNNLA